MSLSSWFSRTFSCGHVRRAERRYAAARPKTARLFLEQLESRVMPSFGLSTLGIFDGDNGASPEAGLIMDGSGNLYGAADGGGANGYGAVFEIAKGSGTITTLASFNGSNGSGPQAGLIMDGSGNLYGTTDGGGANGDGAVFEIAKGSGAITTLASFNGSNGSEPQAGLIMDGSGNLYGTAYAGGADGQGTVFELANGSGAITALASFNGANAGLPEAGLVMDSSGNLYGTTIDQTADGTIFEIAKTGSTYSTTVTTLGTFNGVNGGNPAGGLYMDSGGNLYGTTEYGGVGYTGSGLTGDGAIFELAKGSGTITSLAFFNGADGSNPTGVIADSSGNLYGTTEDGGANGDGAVFEIAKGSGTITTLASFNGSDGSNPQAGLIMDSSGNFYGTTVGGVSGEGSVFELLPHTPALSWNALSPITYGTALSSAQLDATAADSITGAAVAGTFVYTPAAGTILQAGSQTLSVTFTPTDTIDYNPITTSVALEVDQLTPVLTWNNPDPITAGTPLSGTQLDATAADPNTGSPLSGTFAYTPPAGTIVGRGASTLTVTFTPTDTTDYSTAYASATLVVGPSSGLSTLGFFNGADGDGPTGGLVRDASGNLYGTTYTGGAYGGSLYYYNFGTVFEIAAGSGAITTLASFNGANGQNPNAGLVMDGSGNLYGTTVYGGAYGYGDVFEVAKGSGAITVLASFEEGVNGDYPSAGLIMDSSGNLYGTTSEGGVNNAGTIFEVVKGSRAITVLTDGGGSSAGLIMDSSGNLYGTNSGVFELPKGSSTLTTLATFDGVNGYDSDASLIMDSSGNLYGTTLEGGVGYEYGFYNGYGTVFELAKGSGTIMTLVSFDGPDGENPSGGLVMDSGGNLYGTTQEGGYGDGSVFELAKGSGTPSTLVSFQDGSGAFPGYSPTGLIMDGSGNLYGTAGGGSNAGCGTVFEILPHTPALSWGAAPISYGTALSSTQLDASAVDAGTGAAVAGTYVYTPAAGTILHPGWQTLSVTFTPTDTADFSPITTITPLLVNQATPVITWNIAPIPYGTPLSSTQLDATAANPNNGSVVAGAFVYTPGTGPILPRGSTILNVTFTPTDTTDYTTAQASATLVVTPSYAVSTLASFNGTNGSEPVAGLIMDSNGNFYGTTYVGGASGDGTVFEVAAGSSSVTTLASFNGANGSYPEAGLILDSTGNLYGTTEGGGASGDGTVFEVVAGSSSVTTLASFNGANGSYPEAGLIQDSTGNLYGTTKLGGAYRDGTVFELAKGSSTISTRASFSGSNGSEPVAGLIMDSNGNLYGTTELGGASGDGAIFELAKGSSTITRLASFNGAAGYNAEPSLIMDSSGDLYGTNELGGASGDGAVFELAAGGSTIITLASFNGANGNMPWGGLIMDGSGNLYGTTQSGGANGDGTVFEVGAGSGLITTLVSFNGSNGSEPLGGVIMDSGGNLYGTTEGGGANADGTVFEIPVTAAPAITSPGSATLTAGSISSFMVTATGAPIDTLAETATLPSGVTFSDSGNNSGALVVSSAAAAGVYNLTFTATNSIGGPASQPFTLTVNDMTTTSVTANPSGPYLTTTPITFTATIAGNPSVGTVTFYAGPGLTNPIGSAVNVVSGSATSLSTTLLAGNDTIAAVYSGGTDFAGSQNTDSITVLATTTISLVDNGPNASVVGTGVSYTVNTTGVPDGATVSLKDADYSDMVVGSVTIASNTGSTTVSTLSIGTHHIFAAYAGDAMHGASQSSPTILQTVNPIAVTSVIVNQDYIPVVDGSESGNTVTLTTNGNSGFTANNTMIVAGYSGIYAGYNGTWTIATVSGNQITYTDTNGSLPAFSYDTNGFAISANTTSDFIGAQRSMVDSIAYTFNTAVNLTAAAISLGVESSAAITDSNSPGVAPNVVLTALNGGTSSATWVVTFVSGNGATVTGHSIADGAYSIALDSSDVTAGGATMTTTRPTDYFYRLFADFAGNGAVTTRGDYVIAEGQLGLSVGYSSYLADADYLSDGAFTTRGDYPQVENRLGDSITNVNATI